MTATSPLRELGEEIWALERRLRVAGLEVGTRMTVIRLADGGLFLHSPVAPDADTRAALDALGSVRHVVAPSRVHHLFVGLYAESHPGARLYAAPGLERKRPDVAFDEVLGDAPPAAWAGQIEQVLFAGAPYMNEVVFYHPRSRSLLLTDLAMNVYESDSLPTRLWFRLAGVYGRFGVSRYVRWMIRDRDAARASLERILAWDFERVIVTHGIVLQHGARRVFRQAFAWLEDRG